MRAKFASPRAGTRELAQARAGTRALAPELAPGREPAHCILSTTARMFQKLVPASLRDMPPAARGPILRYVAAGLFLLAVVWSDVNVYVQCVVVIYTQIFMVFAALRR